MSDNSRSPQSHNAEVYECDRRDHDDKRDHHVSPARWRSYLIRLLITGWHHFECHSAGSIYRLGGLPLTPDEDGGTDPAPLLLTPDVLEPGNGKRLVSPGDAPTLGCE